MKKNSGITFAKKDEDLVKYIEQYQKDNKIDTFTEAVRKLLNQAIAFEKAKSEINK